MRLRGAISPRPEMRKNVTAITAQRAPMWKDHHQGDPDASTISPKAVRNTPNAAKSSPASAGFSFFLQHRGPPSDRLGLRRVPTPRPID